MREDHNKIFLHFHMAKFKRVLKSSTLDIWMPCYTYSNDWKTRTDPECSDGTPPLEPPTLRLSKKIFCQKMRKIMLRGGLQSPFFDFFLVGGKKMAISLKTQIL